MAAPRRDINGEYYDEEIPRDFSDFGDQPPPMSAPPGNQGSEFDLDDRLDPESEGQQTSFETGEREEISIMPYAMLMGTSYAMVFGSFYVYTEVLYKQRDGADYNVSFYATQLAWIPVLVTMTTQMFTREPLVWEFIRGAMWEAVAGSLVYNWFGLAWAQYKRAIKGETALFSSDNLKALSINLVWNIFSMWWTGYIVSNFIEMDNAIKQSQNGESG